MKKPIYKKLLSVVIAFAFMCALFCISTAAMGYREGIAREGNGPMDHSASDSIMNDDGAVSDDMSNGNVDSGDDGHIGTSSGTGEFADDTSDTDRNMADTENKNNTDGPVESAVDGMANGAADAVDSVTDATTGNSGIWGIIVVIIIIAVIAILVFVFFSKKK